MRELFIGTVLAVLLLIAIYVPYLILGAWRAYNQWLDRRQRRKASTKGKHVKRKMGRQ